MSGGEKRETLAEGAKKEGKGKRAQNCGESRKAISERLASAISRHPLAGHRDQKMCETGKKRGMPTQGEQTQPSPKDSGKRR